jgi:predicted HTH domain antitoxin
MQITVTLPDDLAAYPNPGREALESLVIAGYQAGVLSHFLASQVLELARFELERFLEEKQIVAQAYDEHEWEEDMALARQIRAHGLQR